MYLFFDTETTGLPRNYKAPLTAFDNWPRMVQIAWMQYDESGSLLSETSYIIKPEGYQIPEAVSKLHGITTERAFAEGRDLADVLLEFSDMIRQSEYLVAHNIGFDEKIVLVEFLRKNIETTFSSKKQFCTMNIGTNVCKIPGPYGFKWPRLSELHRTLFNTDFEEV